MPFKSEKQKKYLMSQKPEIAKKFVKDTKIRKLREKLKKKGK